MLLTITTTYKPATDLGFLLRKNPSRAQTFEFSGGRAHVFYPEASEARCTAALLLELDTVGLARGSSRRSLRQYVNDRPYVASSFLSTALLKVFGSAMSGASKDRPEAAAAAMPLTARISMIACPGGDVVVKRLFEPLGYEVKATPYLIDSQFPEWGESRLHTVEISGAVRLSALLEHIYVLVPVLDTEKHYWIDKGEIDKLLKRGEGWLLGHPDREFIVRRYLGHLRMYTSEALERLIETDQVDPEVEEEAEEREAPEEKKEEPMRLADARRDAVISALKAQTCHRVLDLGCGHGRLLRALLEDSFFEEVVGMDVSHRALETARERLHLDRMPEARRARLKLLHGSLTYRDARLSGFDGAAVVEVIEHLDPPRLDAFERALFEFAKTRVAVITTPNVEYNVRFDMAPRSLRHPDHRFEWTRDEFALWSSRAATKHGYEVSMHGIGPSDDEVGCPTQMAVFTR